MLTDVDELVAVESVVEIVVEVVDIVDKAEVVVVVLVALVLEPDAVACVRTKLSIANLAAEP